jgi:DNA-binding response OmpR family regulator
VLVVIAERDPYELQALRAAFEAPDCEVLAGYDGKVALTLTRERHPEAVVVSSSLGAMGGFAVAREIKTSTDSGEIPEPQVVVLLERDADAWLAKWSRADAWVTKPVDPVDVEALVRRLVGTKAASV